jgi:hypothetical protein
VSSENAEMSDAQAYQRITLGVRTATTPLLRGSRATEPLVLNEKVAGSITSGRPTPTGLLRAGRYPVSNQAKITASCLLMTLDD